MEVNSTITQLKKAEVCSRLGISQRTLDNLVRDKKFPPAVRIGKWAYWSSVAVEAHRARLFKMQEQWSPTARKAF